MLLRVPHLFVSEGSPRDPQARQHQEAAGIVIPACTSSWIDPLWLMLGAGLVGALIACIGLAGRGLASDKPKP